MDDGLTQVLDWKDARGRTWFLSFEVQVSEGSESYRGARLSSPEADLTPAVLRKFTHDLGALKERDAAARRFLWREIGDEAAMHRIRGTKPGPPRKYASEDVARIWKDARRKGKPPGRAVEERFKVSPGYASRLVARARHEGLLDEGKN